MTPHPDSEKAIDRRIRRKTIFSFSILLIGFAIAYSGWKWLNHQPLDNQQPEPLRVVLNANEKVNTVFFSTENQAKEYPKSAAAKKVRVNGKIGLGKDFDADKWNLTINRHKGEANDTLLKLEIQDIKALPKRDVIFDFKCIEGWSQVSHWGGVRFSDFMIKYHLGTKSGKAPDPNHPEDLYKYVGLVTPDGKYYVGIDMKSMMQPQTILCYELNEMPLPIDQGYPLRLIITVKYGVKNLKRIGTIFFSDTPPADYWHEHGYDYDAAL